MNANLWRAQAHSLERMAEAFPKDAPAPLDRIPEALADLAKLVFEFAPFLDRSPLKVIDDAG